MKKQETKWLYTEEGKNLPSVPHNVYPRPQFRRDSFFCLNGEWDFTTESCDRELTEYKEKIIVPFCPESLLSGVHREIAEGDFLYYRRTFTLPCGFVRDRVILHFGAVDCICEVSLNGKKVGEHIGGYHPFSFDVTEFLLDGENTLSLKVSDTLSDIYPYGKQRRDRGGMWYTPTSGIWQTVWIESVAENYIKGIKTDVSLSQVEIGVYGVSSATVTVKTPNGEIKADTKENKVKIEIPDPVLWSPENPYLYEFSITSGEDKVDSYFALRTLETKEVNGTPRLCLNGKPYYFHGLLDQGYYSDGAYTPATPEMYKKDIDYAKRMGFNTLRKHIKIEPQLFYYYCDKLGMIVFQDMVNNGNYSFMRDTALPTVLTKKFPIGKKANPKEKAQEQFLREMKDTVALLYNHPSICYWTIFNEGWGQFGTDNAYEILSSLDKSRFIDTASGWFKPKYSDVESLHIYFKKVKLKKSEKPIVLSEFGGYSYKLPDHSFNKTNTYGYGKFDSSEEFHEAVASLYENEIIPAIENGLCADIYTQLSDVEDETNGMYTYDRCVEKANAEKLSEIASKLFSNFDNSTKM